MRFVPMLLNFVTLTLSVAASAAPSVDAGQHLVWSNTRGLVEYQACSVSPVVAHPSASVEKQLGDQLNDLTTRAVEVNHYLNLPGSTSPTQTFWQATRDESGALQNLTCETEKGPRSYVVFSVYDSQQIEPIASVGVRADELSILQTEVAPAPLTMAKVSTLSSLDLPASVLVQEGSLENLVCIDSGVLNVRSEDLNSVLFTANRHEPIKLFQSFDAEKPKKTISGTSYTFVKVQFTNRTSGKDIGWIPEQYALAKSACPGANSGLTPTAPAATLAWRFPTVKRPTTSYKSGMRMFNAGRSGSRIHAACDLYRVKDEQAVAVTAGKVIRNTYFFYEGTYAIEVLHTGGKTARYGEITGKAAPSIALNATVKAGQTVGYIGKVNSNCCEPMLHFELYSGTKSGALSQPGANKYGRRTDLMNPTTLLTEWEKATFGTSY
jgi:murein DD-endopeptidase MepM/ murein hydrolase activator NlpD